MVINRFVRLLVNAFHHRHRLINVFKYLKKKIRGAKNKKKN